MLSSKSFWKKTLSLCLSVTFFFTSLGVSTAQALVIDSQFPVDNIQQIIDAVPTGQRWLDHLNNDLLPFWSMPEAVGTNGNFPTYRCNDGTLYNPNNDACIGLENPVPGIVWLDRDYVRSKSRQVFAYGIAYNLTGEAKYLQWAKQGVDFLRAHALVQQGTLGASTYFPTQNGQPAPIGTAGQPLAPSTPEEEQRISQDMTYALSGLAMFYYLTRDADVLTDIVNVKNYIFDTYYNKEWDLIAWVRKGYQEILYPDGKTLEVSPEQRELVAQLDQVYAYMMLLTPILPEYVPNTTIPLKKTWEDDLVHLATIMSEQFYTPDKNIFWGAITDSEIKKLGTDHTDFGHSIKTLWLIYTIGKVTGHYEFVLFAQEAAPKILEKAYLADGTWGRRVNLNGTVDPDKEWWILAELDQVAATFSLRDPSYAKYLPTTYGYWFEHMVDHTPGHNGGVWHWVNAADNKPDLRFPKQHSWKNAFHTFEHAIVCYLTGQEIHDEKSELYFAFKGGIQPEITKIRPYLYAGKIVPSISTLNIEEPIPGYIKQKVTFVDIR
jgi:mannose/cellobiose epimerase-like protein (N-acyl-D-glucosamine 2-epimerase family)